MSTKTINTITYHSPVGILQLAEYENALCMCDRIDSLRHRRNVMRIECGFAAGFSEETTPLLNVAVEQLEEYFSQRRKVFTVPLRFAGTDFQIRVWRGVQSIAFGDTLSYAALARNVGRERAVRAVAGAVASNPLSIFVPCHRVVASGGSLGGYAGGIVAKRHLLAIEGDSLICR